MKTLLPFAGILLILFVSGTSELRAQTGDQILDGIGETEMIARYIFKGDLKDWSRNNLHAGINGTDFRFTDDELFGSVLSLTGESEVFISIPGEAVSGQESLSITG